jgi:LemA protein
VLIRPKGASVDAPQRTRDTHSSKPQRYSRFSLLQSLGGAVPLSFDLSRYRTTEWYLLPGDPVYVLGEATLRSDAVALEFSPCDPTTGVHKRSLLVASGDERRAARRTAVIATVLLIVTVAAAACLPAAFHALRTAQGDGPAPGDPSTISAAGFAMTVAAASVIVVLAITYVARLFNRLVAVRNRAQAAWSLIDIHLRRRHDLLPALAEVVGAAAAHERTVQESVARLRAAVPLPPQAELPDRTQLAATEAADTADRADSRALLAVSEAYPDLKTAENFQKLAAEVAATENGIAFARAFYNDAINVLRDRRQRFPGVLLARFVPVPSLELWSTDDPKAIPTR